MLRHWRQLRPRVMMQPKRLTWVERKCMWGTRITNCFGNMSTQMFVSSYLVRTKSQIWQSVLTKLMLIRLASRSEMISHLRGRMLKQQWRIYQRVMMKQSILSWKMKLFSSLPRAHYLSSAVMECLKTRPVLVLSSTLQGFMSRQVVLFQRLSFTRQFSNTIHRMSIATCVLHALPETVDHWRIVPSG